MRYHYAVSKFTLPPKINNMRRIWSNRYHSTTSVKYKKKDLCTPVCSTCPGWRKNRCVYKSYSYSILNHSNAIYVHTLIDDEEVSIIRFRPVVSWLWRHLRHRRELRQRQCCRVAGSCWPDPCRRRSSSCRCTSTVHWPPPHPLALPN